jgi:hypothetical protein
VSSCPRRRSLYDNHRRSPRLEEGASFSRSHEELQADLRACIAVVEEAMEEFDRDDQGGLITFGEGE